MLADCLTHCNGMNVLVTNLPASELQPEPLTERGVQDATDQGKAVHHVLAGLKEGKPP